VLHRPLEPTKADIPMAARLARMTPGTSSTNSAIAPLGLRHSIDPRPYHTRSRWWVRAVLCVTAKSDAECPLRVPKGDI